VKVWPAVRELVPAPVRAWEVWRLPPRGAAFVLVVAALPWIALPAALAFGDHTYRLVDLRHLLELSVVAVASVAIGRKVGMPSHVRGHPYPDLVSVWLFAITLLLPPEYVALAALVLVPLLVRGVVPTTYRAAFNIGSLALSGLAAHEVMRLVGGNRTLPEIAQIHGDARRVWAVLAALLAYEAVNVTLVAIAITQIEPGVPLRQAFGDANTLATDLTALALGLLAALAWTVAPVLTVAVLPPVVLLQRALIHDELRHAAQTDGRTGLSTAVHWLGLARRAVERAATDRTVCGLLIIDIDHFKQVNDTWGHLAGDDVLIQMADTLRASVRPGDLIGRLGGEEFGVLLPGTGLVEAAAVAERLRAAVADAEVRVPGPGRRNTVQVTISAGVATTLEAGYLVEELTAAADAALYRAKAAGRDRVETALTDTAPLVLSQPRTPLD
jgi:diguanylate cyclase (GGDEF)-like protein